MYEVCEFLCHENLLTWYSNEWTFSKLQWTLLYRRHKILDYSEIATIQCT